MHYLVEVGFPSHLVKDAGIGLDSRKSDYNEVMMRIEGEVQTIMEKYNENLEETMMGEYGITPHYTDGAEDEDGKTYLYNPEGLWDWFSIGGRWRNSKVPAGLGRPDKFKDLYNSLHDSKLHEGCRIPCYIMFMREPCDMQSIYMFEIADEHLGTENFKDFRAKWDETGKYEDYIWTSVDIHN